MGGEQGGDERGSPDPAGEQVQEDEHQHGVDGVQDGADRVRSSRFHPEQLDVQHVRQPGQGMPIGRVPGGERPAHVLHSQPGEDARIFQHVFRVVEVRKRVADGRPKQTERQQRQQQADQSLRSRFSFEIHHQRPRNLTTEGAKYTKNQPRTTGGCENLTTDYADYSDSWDEPRTTLNTQKSEL